MTGQLWWRYQEGIYLLGTLVLLSAAVGYCGWLYQQTLPARNIGPHCGMNTVILIVPLVLILYALPFLGWQVSLVRRRVAGKPVTAWGVVAFLGSLLPIIYLGYRTLLI